MRLDKVALKRETKRLGCDTWADVADRAGIADRTVRRSLEPRSDPSVHLLAWLVSQGVDLRKVWLPA